MRIVRENADRPALDTGLAVYFLCCSGVVWRVEVSGWQRLTRDYATFAPKGEDD